MKLSTKGRYGLRALIDLALYSENETVSIASISARQNISESYLEQLIAKLKRAGLVESIRGAAGGYRLARSAEEISVGDILRALEGNLTPIECPALEAESECVKESSCVTKVVWKRIDDALKDAVDNISLQELKQLELANEGR